MNLSLRTNKHIPLLFKNEMISLHSLDIKKRKVDKTMHGVNGKFIMNNKITKIT